MCLCASTSLLCAAKPYKWREKMDIEFRKITEFPRGTLAALLKDGYSFEPKFERDWHKQWKEFDDFFMCSCSTHL